METFGTHSINYFLQIFLNFCFQVWHVFNLPHFLLILSNYTGDFSHTEYCTIELDEDKLKALTYAVENHYWYQMYIDDLPIWGELNTSIDLELVFFFQCEKIESMMYINNTNFVR